MDMGPHDMLFEAGRAFWRDELHQSLQLTTLAIEEFRKLGNSEGLVIALQNRSTAHRELFYSDESLSAVKHAQIDASMSLAVVGKNNLGFLYGLACFHIAEAEVLTRNYDEAIYYFEKALLSFHHTGVLAQKGHYCFRLGEAHYRADSRRKGHASEMMVRGLSQLKADSLVYPFPFVYLLLMSDCLLYAQLLLREGRQSEAQQYINVSEQLIVDHPELVLSKRKFENMKRGLEFYSCKLENS